MHLNGLDIGIIVGVLLVTLLIGLYTSKRAGKGAKEFFLGGANMPWWLLGVSMVATTFAADTPNLVTGIIRQDGVVGNWVWWGYLLTGMLTVFVYARLWRRLGITTDLEFYEVRYQGGVAAFLRGFRAFYLGIIFNVVVMAVVCLAAIKIANITMGLEAWQTLTVGAVVTTIYSALGGLRGVLLTDFFQFIIAMTGSIWAAVYLLNMEDVGGMDALLVNSSVQEKMNFLPEGIGTEAWLILLIPLTIQWWSSWYPGAEPGGGGYIAQRMLSAKSEQHATSATLFFNLAHYALRPWPWIIIALISLVAFPLEFGESNKAFVSPDAEEIIREKTPEGADAFLYDEVARQALIADSDQKEAFNELSKYLIQNPNSLDSKALAYIYYKKSTIGKGKLKAEENRPKVLEMASLVNLFLADPNIDPRALGHDSAYPAMLTLLPNGLIGLVLASLIAAFMSTISTHLNWGSSYVVNDLYGRFVKPDASPKALVRIGRASTVLMMLLSALLALVIDDAVEGFMIIVEIGAGTGLLFILRWFWWRINPWSEITAMVVSFALAMILRSSAFEHYTAIEKLLTIVVLGNASWILVAFLTSSRTTDPELAAAELLDHQAADHKTDDVIFKKFAQVAFEGGKVPLTRIGWGVLAMVLGSGAIYGILFGTGSMVYHQFDVGLFWYAIAGAGSVGVYLTWVKKLFPKTK